MLTKNQTYCVLVADDHPLILYGITQLLQTNPLLKSIYQARTCDEVIKMFELFPYDILVTDISMPGMSGIDLCKIIKRGYPRAKIIVYTQFKEISLVHELLEINVEAIVSKETDNNDLLTAVKAVIEGKRFFSYDISQLLIENISNKKRMETQDIQLTKREKQVLDYLANENTTREIAKQMGISFNTVETYRKNLLSKLCVKNTVGLIKKAIEKDLIG